MKRKEKQMEDENKKIAVENTSVKKTFDGSALGSTIVKYVAYIVITFGVLYFIVRYVFPMFK